VADSSLVTGENLTALCEMDLPLISRNTFEAVDDEWEMVETVAGRRHAASYWACEHSVIMGETTYRFTVWRSSALDTLKEAKDWNLNRWLAMGV
jgi:hypothetical protein